MEINKEQTAEKSIHGILGASENFPPPIIHQCIIGKGKLNRNCHFQRSHYDTRWSQVLTLIVGFWSNFSGDPAVRPSF